MGGMVDITNKKEVYREATAQGKIILKKSTIEKIKSGLIKKGDPLTIATVAGINSSKMTHLLIPHCHQLLLNTVEINFNVNSESIEAIATVKTSAKTGVEMESLVAVTTALNTIWDMTKYLEKDECGQYPSTKIENIRVTKKHKGL